MLSSEFKFKGTFLISTKKIMEKEFDTGYTSQMRPKYYPESHTLASSWYPAKPIVDILKDFANEKKISYRDLVLKHTQYVLDSDLNGVYKLFIKLGGIKRVLNALPQLNKSYCNWNEIEIIKNEDGCFIADVTFPKSFELFYLIGAEGGIGTIIRLCGKSLTSFELISKSDSVGNNTDLTKLNYLLKYI